MNKLKSHVLLIFIILIAIVLGIVIAAGIVFYVTFENSGKIAPGVFIKGVNISGMTKEEAGEAVSNYLSENMADHLTFSYSNYEYDVEVEQFDSHFDVDSAVEYAFQIGRNKGFVKNIKDYISSVMNQINIEPELVYDEEALDDYMDFLETSLPDQVEQAGYYIDNDELVITTGATGVGIQKEVLESMLLASLQDISYSNQVFVIPTYTTYPDALNLTKIHSEVYKPMVNASYTTNPYSFTVEETGVDFDVDEVAQTVLNVGTDEEYRFDLEYTNPEVKVSDFGMDAFPDLLGKHSTTYVNNANRTTNLRLASNAINGTVLMPGETFSFNSTVGPRTAARGYKEAAIYADGTVTDGIGGGICQVVTTLYNATIQADLEITERRNHTFVPSYANPGYDATVAYGSQDFKFTNSRSYPIKIVSSVENGYCTVSIYGLKTDNEYEVSIETEIIKTIPKKTSSGQTGYVADSYRVTKQNGTIISREKISRDTYSAR
jgi:vancomycin resistance protein YoaR